MTSRLFKRMSSSMSISSASRKNLAALSPTVQEEDHEANLPSLRDPPPAVQVGDLNIQFPDTLVNRDPHDVFVASLTLNSSGKEDGSRLMARGILS
jgi:hypothetical protein